VPVPVAHAVEPARAAPIPGQVIGGRFRIERELGVGGMGAVYAARDQVTGARVALKLMREELTGDERAIERFRREGAALAAIDHPAVVGVREVGELDDGTLFLAMELLEGETLAARLERSGRIGPEELLPIVIGLCEGLSAAHAGGVIHRDLKPSNVHLPEPGSSVAAVKLVDFGVARVRGFSKVTSSGLAVGTVRYMAPEQLAGGAVDERADIYALGLIIYEALAGEHPFERTAKDDAVGAVLVGRVTPLSSLRPDLPPAITSVVHRAMSRVAVDRFASATELARAFQNAVAAPNEHPFPDQTRAPRSLAYAPTALAPVALPATSDHAVRAPDQSAVRTKAPAKQKKKRPYRALVFIALPLVLGACFVPVLGVAGFIGCGSATADLQLDLYSTRMNDEIARDPELAPYGVDLAVFRELANQDRVNLLAASAFNSRVQRALRDDDQVDPSEASSIMELVRDINAHGGEYTIEQFSKMTDPTP
jgi:eukaryotic-like serine/threonine-protein kinase